MVLGQTLENQDSREQRSGRSSSSRVMGWEAIRESTSWNKANRSTFTSSQLAQILITIGAAFFLFR
jgi:hypothetical protein